MASPPNGADRRRGWTAAMAPPVSSRSARRAANLYVTWADKEVGQRKVHAMMEDFHERIRPHVDAMVAGITEHNKQMAADFGIPHTDETRDFWGILGNVCQAIHDLPSNAPELRAVLDLARTVLPRQRNQWSEAKHITDELFDDLDGGGALGLGDLLDPNVEDQNFGLGFTTAEGRLNVLRIVAKFHAVPPAYGPAVGDIVDALMNTHGGWDYAPQHMSVIYAYVVGAIVGWVKPEIPAKRATP